MAKTRLIGGARGESLSGRIEVEGLSESIRALNKWDKKVKGEAVDIFRDEAKMVQKKAQARLSLVPSAPRKAVIGRSATGAGAGVKLRGSAFPRAFATEFGMHKWHQRTWGGTVRGWVQSALSRRTFLPYKGVQFDVKGGSGPGYVIQHTLRKVLPGMEERVADRLSKLLTKELNKAGVPRG